MADEEIVVQEEPKELVIDESNFHEYFFDVRMHRPKRGQVMARYSGIAEFVDGRMKQDVVDLLRTKDKGQIAVQVLRKLGCATERDAIRVCKEICQDLLTMPVEEVIQKTYKYTIEVFYYTQKEYVPTDDPHWSVISLINAGEFFTDAAGNKLKMEAKVVKDEKTTDGE